jgi:hypothetical protein
MTLYLRTRRIALLLAACLLIPTVAFLASGIAIAVPSFGSGSPFASLALSTLLAVALPLLLATVLHAATRPPANSAVRLVHIYDVAPTVVVALLAVLIAQLIKTLTGWEAWLNFTRSALGFTGLALTGRALLGYRLEALIAVLYVFFAAVFGRTGGGETAAWGWMIDPTYHSWHLMASLLLVALGATLAVLARTSALASHLPS